MEPIWTSWRIVRSERPVFEAVSVANEETAEIISVVFPRPGPPRTVTLTASGCNRS